MASVPAACVYFIQGNGAATRFCSVGISQCEKLKEEHVEKMDDGFEGVDPAITEILRELDEYVIDSQNEDQNAPEKNYSMVRLGTH